MTMSSRSTHCQLIRKAGAVVASLGVLAFVLASGGCSVEVPGDEEEQAGAERVGVDGADDGSDIGKADDDESPEADPASSCELPAWHGRTCNELRWNTDECTACMESRCCDEVNACTGDETCSRLRQCMNENDCWYFHDSDHWCIQDHCSDCHTEEAEDLAIEWTECLYKQCYWKCIG